MGSGRLIGWVYTETPERKGEFFFLFISYLAYVGGGGGGEREEQVCMNF